MNTLRLEANKQLPQGFGWKDLWGKTDRVLSRWRWRENAEALCTIAKAKGFSVHIEETPKELLPYAVVLLGYS